MLTVEMLRENPVYRNTNAAGRTVEIVAVPSEDDFTKITSWEIYKTETGYKPEIYKNEEEAIARFNELTK